DPDILLEKILHLIIVEKKTSCSAKSNKHIHCLLNNKNIPLLMKTAHNMLELFIIFCTLQNTCAMNKSPKGIYNDGRISKEDLFKMFSPSSMLKIDNTMKKLINVFVGIIFDNVLGFVIIFCQKSMDYFTHDDIIKYLQSDKRHKEDLCELFRRTMGRDFANSLLSV
ncbi:hypothetical protein RFI_39487, partial [Reticulomyxa filosa]